MSQDVTQPVLGWWIGERESPEPGENLWRNALYQTQLPLYILERKGRHEIGRYGYAVLGHKQPQGNASPLVGYAPPCSPKNLGDPDFCVEYGVEYPYIAGAMANGCTSVEIVEAMGQEGMLGFFGSAGLPVEQVEAAIDRISGNLGARPYGFNLIHSPSEPALEAAVVDLYLRRKIKLISASAYLGLTLPVVRYRVHGIHRDSSGRIITPNRILAKVSRVEVATRFFSPPPEQLLRELIANGDITEEQAQLASQIPMAQDITAEADSGGHTDNRPSLTLTPTMLALRDRMQAQYSYVQNLRVGVAGGIGTPVAAAAAFAMGAAYIVTGSVNQACVESGTSDIVRQMLAETQQADVVMAPAADMFEMGVKVQVLKRGTMFAMRAAKLHEIYRQYTCLEELPAELKQEIEKKIFRYSLEAVWEQTYDYFLKRDITQIERANCDSRYKMALIFRWYLGQSSRWSMTGDPSRKIDYQIWCGPSMGAFNEWTRGSFLEDLQQRHVAIVALNILYGASVVSRANLLRSQGIQIPAEFTNPTPLSRKELEQYL